MKKNTLFVSVAAVLGSFIALFTVLTTEVNPQYSSREEVNKGQNREANFDFFTIMRTNINTGQVEPMDFIKAVEETKKFKNSRATNLGWDFVGPDNIGGRTRAIVIDMDDPNLLYAGGAGGGLFVSTNAAGSWEYRSSDWENLKVSTIVQDGSGRLYVGTGMFADAGAPNALSFPGGGIWTSSDRGDTWSRLAATVPQANTRNDGWAFINRMATSKSPNADGKYSVYAATNGGLKVSVDNGVTWTNAIKQNCSFDLTTRAQDVVTTASGKVMAVLGSGLFISPDGDACTFDRKTLNSAYARMTLAVCDMDEDMVYAFQSYGADPATFQIYSSADGGETWGDLQPAPPTAIIDSTFDLMGSNPAAYNQAISVDPSNCDRIYIGAVELYRVHGAWSSVAINFGTSSFKVHSDKHWFAFSPHDPNIMYVGSDGGVGKTVNAAASTVSWTENNRHYGTTEYYGVATTKHGQVIGGTQDNGTHLIDPNLSGDAGKDGLNIFGGDGFDCEVSNISEVAFVTSQYSVVGRGTYGAGADQGLGAMIHTQRGPFHTVIRLWESDHDVTSKDSVVFVNDTSSFAIGVGDGVKKLYSGTLRRLQIAAKIIPGQLRFVDIAGGQFADDSDVPGVIKSFGDSVGSVNYITGEYSVRWAFAPPAGSSISSIFNVKFDSGDTLDLVSQNQSIPFTYVLQSGLAVNDSVSVQDPVQSLLAVSMGGGFNITRESLYFPLSNPAWKMLHFAGSGAFSSPSCFEFTDDGNHVYVGLYNGTVVRVSGLNSWYSGNDPDSVLTQTTVFTGVGPVAGINLHPTEMGQLLVTTGGYGFTNHVYELSNALGTPQMINRRNIHGNLPDFPVYDPEYNVNNTNQVLIGTELGLWATDDVTAASVSWTQQSGAMGNVPVMDVRQQRLPHNEASNYGRFYLGTFGRGIWTSGDLVSVDEPWADFSDAAVGNLKMYPNPVSSPSKLTFDLAQSGTVNISIFDITGKMVVNEMRNYAAGESTYDVDPSSLSNGTYFVTVQSGTITERTKFVVVK